MRAETAAGQVFAPVITPFAANYAPDSARLAAHCRWLVASGVGLTLFGTNSEANSLAVADRQALLDALVADGLAPAQMMVGVGCCSIEDTVALTRHALAAGCRRVLMLPPFYYKDVTDDGLFRYFSQVIERVADDRLRLYLYHISPVAQVGIGFGLIERLRESYPNTLAGIKDSSGDVAHTRALAEAFAGAGFAVFTGSERDLLATLAAGGAGCISGTANVNPAPIARLAANAGADDAAAYQAELARLRAIFEARPAVPAVKAAAAHFTGAGDWARVRPPLVELGAGERAELVAALEDIGFAMPGAPG